MGNVPARLRQMFEEGIISQRRLNEVVGYLRTAELDWVPYLNLYFYTFEDTPGFTRGNDLESMNKTLRSIKDDHHPKLTLGIAYINGEWVEREIPQG
jgi:hypothetical protein